MLWWGHFDLNYSRNRIIHQILTELGWTVTYFRPRLSFIGDWEALFENFPKPDLIWVPCFRQRDMMAASRWAKRNSIPVIFDPLISAYDKQVNERKKFKINSLRAKYLLMWERDLFRKADIILADTYSHADYFSHTFKIDHEKITVVYVGAESNLFFPSSLLNSVSRKTIEFLFYGSFIHLQDPRVIIEAARIYRGPPVNWTLLGQGPLLKECQQRSVGLANVTFENWLPYEQLPNRMRKADVLLGIFGDTPKAARVIPNKVFQSLACGRPVITRQANAYPQTLLNDSTTGLVWCPENDPIALAQLVAHLAENSAERAKLAIAAAETSNKYFSLSILREQLKIALTRLVY